MLEPSANFTAQEVIFLQTEATEWIEYVNKKIIEAASNGKSEVTINITNYDPIGCKYWHAPGPLIEHFKSRGFIHEWGGQSSCGFKWEKMSVPQQREFINIESLPNTDSEGAEEKTLKEKLMAFLLGDKNKSGNA